MNKKADTTTLSFVGSLVISAIVVLALIAIIYIILPQAGKESTDVTTFYYKAMIKSLREIKNEAKLPFLPNKGYALVGFSKNINEINILDDKCGKFQLSSKISRPISCQGGCLCLCNVDTGLLNFGSNLVISCSTEKSICESFNENIVGDESCNYFLYYSNDQKPKEFLASKKQETITIKSK